MILIRSLRQIRSGFISVPLEINHNVCTNMHREKAMNPELALGCGGRISALALRWPTI